MLCPSGWVSGWPVSLRVETPVAIVDLGTDACPGPQTEDPVGMGRLRGSVGWGDVLAGGKWWERQWAFCWLWLVENLF